MNLDALLATYGYPLVFVGSVVEGEVIVIAAGYFAHRHHLSIALVAGAAALGGAVGDLGYFSLGKRYGERGIRRLPASIRADAERARGAVQTNPVRVLLAMRFLYGLRVLLPMLCGASPMRLGRFARYDVATAIAWSAIFSGIGYGFGTAAEAAIDEIEHYEWCVIPVLLAIAFVMHRASKRLSPLVAP